MTPPPPLSNGYTLWRGPSRFTGEEIAIVAVGMIDPSANRKTGPMVQVYILPCHRDPIEAYRDDQAKAVCGGCPVASTCYVRLDRGPLQAWRQWAAGRYPEATAAVLRGRHVRIGAWGDPCAAPNSVWKPIVRAAAQHSAYTHHANDYRNRGFRSWCMASVERIEDARRLRERGWRTYRITGPDDDPAAGEIRCPGSKEAGRASICYTCHLCRGAGRSPSIAVRIHSGPTQTLKGRYRKLLERLPPLEDSK